MRASSSCTRSSNRRSATCCTTDLWRDLESRREVRAPVDDPIAGEPIERRVADRVDRVGAQDRVALGGVEERADDRVALVPPAPGAPDRVEHDRHRLVSVGGVAARGAVVTTPKGPHEPAAGWWELFG